eukprot:3497551-Pyramimonas_sp.AAC.1
MGVVQEIWCTRAVGLHSTWGVRDVLVRTCLAGLSRATRQLQRSAVQYSSLAQYVCNTIAPNLLHHPLFSWTPFWVSQWGEAR